MPPVTFPIGPVLGLESSCDETAAAIVTGDRAILSSVLHSQVEDHRPHGGVVPEIAARAHLSHMDHIAAEALRRAGLRPSDLAGIAATAGPGLVGGVMVGLMTGKAMALALGKPLVAVNHLEAHALSPRLTDGIDYPYLLLLVSGGHTQLLAVLGGGRFTRLGGSVDDAAGEAFDKVARLLELGFPGGPAIERAARQGDPRRFALPRPMKGKPGCDLSFSGLKTAVRQALATLGPDRDSPQARADLAASFQAAVVESLSDRAARAARLFRDRHGAGRALVAAGGVAANAALKQGLAEIAAREGFSLVIPPPALCTDNGAMIAWAGIERLAAGLTDGLDAPARPRWPLDAAPPAVGAHR